MIEKIKGTQSYLGLLTSQHKTKPKYRAMVKVYLEKLDDVVDVLEQLETAFDIDTAIGVQLDIVGAKVGAYRTLNFNPVYADSKLSDHDFRKYIKACISMNQWDGTMKGLRTLWEGLFGEYRITVYDKQNMTIRAEFRGVEDLFESELIAHGYFAPKAVGVGAEYLFVMESKINTTLSTGGGVGYQKIAEEIPTKSFSLEDQTSHLTMGGVIGYQSITEEIPTRMKGA